MAGMTEFEPVLTVLETYNAIEFQFIRIEIIATIKDAKAKNKER